MTEISLAPMMKITTPQFRLLIRKISPNTVLFTEMVVANTINNVDDQKIHFILGSPEDNTVVQIGGSDPKEVSTSILRLKKLGWKYFNLNCGCPSNRVQNGNFGAILMLDKENVANIINETYSLSGISLSLKIRTGVNENDSFDFFKEFIEYISINTVCTKFYVHARKCWLDGLNPKQNRNIPELNHQYVYRIKELFPHLFFSLNGGIKSEDLHKVQNLDGLMIGRHAWDDIKIFAKYENIVLNMKEILKLYFDEVIKTNPPKYKVIMPLINYRKGRSLSKAFKQQINMILHSELDYDQIYDLIVPYID